MCDCNRSGNGYPYDRRINPYYNECNPPRERVSERVYYQDIVYRRPIVVEERIREDIRIGPARLIGETPPFPGPPRRY